MPTERKELSTHLLQGTKPEWTPEPEFASGRPKMPADLSPVAAAEWRRLVPKLCKRKQLSKADASCVELYVRTYSRWRKAEAMAEACPISETSWLDKNGNEHIKQEESPASKIASKLESQLRALLIQLSATPASRKLTKPDKDQKDPVPKTDAALLSREAAMPAPAPVDEEPEPDLDKILAMAEAQNL
jgi:P27 family predicted phage terminase small subunit